jgi:hypothetical protein
MPKAESPSVNCVNTPRSEVPPFFLGASVDVTDATITSNARTSHANSPLPFENENGGFRPRKAVCLVAQLR